MYALLLIAVAEQQGELLRSVGSFAWEIASVLRDPNPGMVVFNVIACLQYLSHVHCIYFLRHSFWAFSDPQDHSSCDVSSETNLTQVRYPSFPNLMCRIWHEG